MGKSGDLPKRLVKWAECSDPGCLYRGWVHVARRKCPKCHKKHTFRRAEVPAEETARLLEGAPEDIVECSAEGCVRQAGTKSCVRCLERYCGEHMKDQSLCRLCDRGMFAWYARMCKALEK
jgi:hypothetical protein